MTFSNSLPIFFFAKKLHPTIGVTSLGPHFNIRMWIVLHIAHISLTLETQVFV